MKNLNTEIQNFFQSETNYDNEDIEFMNDMKNFFENNPDEWQNLKKNFQSSLKQNQTKGQQSQNPAHLSLQALREQYSEPTLVRTSMNFYPEDIVKAKKIAKELGVSYQVFIRDFLHKNLEFLD